MAKRRHGSSVGDRLEAFSRTITQWTGSTTAFGWAMAVIVIWAVLGPVFAYSNTWQLVINTGTTIVTFLMVFLIQRRAEQGLTGHPPEAQRDRGGDQRGQQPAGRRRVAVGEGAGRSSTASTASWRMLCRQGDRRSCTRTRSRKRRQRHAVKHRVRKSGRVEYSHG